ncbi:hypothetical protein [Mucilaginibacter sp. L196]|uniref:hypothetical protein n=1 Tax=Mucilaginibacter sp. L196 TaxID=1641870 RepID=UPI00131DCA17|nr:hypothetical protein [Mucilaginibacter sp. L196]
MTFNIAGFNLKKLQTYVDWKLLLFLLLFLNVKLAVKIPAIIIIYLLQFNFKFGFNFKNSRLPLFYLLVIAIAFINLIINKGYNSSNYLVVFAIGIGFWLLCLLAVHQIKLSVENNSVQVLHNTILVFFVVNAIVSLATLAYIMVDAHAINPFRYQGQYQKYFLGTGDYIKGITLDISTTNAVINAFGVVYFLTRKMPLMVLICMIVLLLTASNFMNIALLLVLTGLFLFKTNRDQKSLIVICCMFLIIFLAKVSPQNNQYVHETFKNIINPPHPPFNTATLTTTDSSKDPDFTKRKFAKQYLDSIKSIVIKSGINNRSLAALPANLPKTGAGRIILIGADINTPPYQTPTDTPDEQRKLLAFIHLNKAELPLSGQDSFKMHLPGKIIGFEQTVNFLKTHPTKILAGSGMGNFSSKLAFKATGFDFSGGFPAKYIYINHDFLLNHLDVYLNFFSKRRELHSLTNSPFSVYDQILAEYGLLGVAAFVIFYLGYFTRHFKKLTYGIPILLLMLAVFLTDYWFEQLSVVVFFELLLLLNIKETAHLKPLNYE